MKKEMNNVTKSELQCEIVQDLLPIYHDNVVNAVTKEAVKEHLDKCETCAKEYEELCEEFPQESVNKDTTKYKFDIMKKKLKKKQVIKTTLIALASCIAVILIGYILLCVPVVPVDDSKCEIQVVYKVGSGDETKLFLIYKYPWYGKGPWFGSSMERQMKAEQKGEECLIHANLKRAVISWVDEDDEEQEYAILKIGSDTKTITFAEETIWSEEENGDDVVPEYVHALVELEESGVDYDSGMSDNCIGIGFDEEGKYVDWDFEGNVIYEVYDEDAPVKYFEGTVTGMDDEYMWIKPFSKYWLANDSDVICVSMNTEEGQCPNDFKTVKVSETVGVYFHGEVKKESLHTINSVANIVVGGANALKFE